MSIVLHYKLYTQFIVRQARLRYLFRGQGLEDDQQVEAVSGDLFFHGFYLTIFDDSNHLGLEICNLGYNYVNFIVY